MKLVGMFWGAFAPDVKTLSKAETPSKNGISPISKLSEELLFQIFLLLASQKSDLLNVRIVCRQWKHVVGDLRLWRNFPGLLEKKLPFVNLENNSFIIQHHYYYGDDGSVVRPAGIMKVQGKIAYVIYENRDFCAL